MRIVPRTLINFAIGTIALLAGLPFYVVLPAVLFIAVMQAHNNREI
jgi:hypothetical protein